MQDAARTRRLLSRPCKHGNYHQRDILAMSITQMRDISSVALRNPADGLSKGSRYQFAVEYETDLFC